jgi:hypothetical protein
MSERGAELDAEDAEEEFVLPPESTFVAARWVKWIAVLFLPLAGLFTWIGWMVVQDWLAGEKSVWILVFLLVTLGGLVFLMLAGLIAVVRARLRVDHEGMLLRGAFVERRIPWEAIEGYRWTNGQLFVYPARDWWPANLSHFENQGLILAWLSRHVADLQNVEIAQEAKEIRAELALGYTEYEKAERLRGLRRLVRTINWLAYVAAAIGCANAFFLEYPIVQAVTACMLVLVPIALVSLALRHRDQVRLDYKEGSLYPEGLTGILASSLALGLMSLLDPHTLLGTERFYQWTVPTAVLAAWLWLSLEWQRIRAQRRWLLIALHVLSIFFLSGFWAGGSVYQVNKHADVSEPVWDETKVIGMRKSQDRSGTSYHVKVAPWSASAEPVELDVSRETYESLRGGAALRVSVRAGALDIPWVDEVRASPK